ncbi:MAG: pitrilysin family protein [Ignavibacteriaceae bacterium]
MMKQKLISMIVLLFVFVAAGFAQNKINFTEYNLDNGMHVILHKDNTTPIVAVTMMYHVGSKNEKSDRTGFAHFFEHLMFEGSPNIPREQYFKIVQNAGGQLNANTSFDRTFFYEILPSNQLKLGLWLESERLLHLKIDSVGVETQRKVVIEERHQRYDNQPYGSVLEETFKRAFKGTPYEWMPIGSAQYIDKATIAEFRNFYKEYYVPQNVTLSIAGDIDINQAKKEIAEYFAGIPKGPEKIYRPDFKIQAQKAEVRDTVYDNIQLPLVLQAYHIPAQGTPDYYALNMLTTILSTGQSSRLYKAVVDKEQKAINVGSFPFALEDAGLFISYGICNAGVKANDLEASMQTELDKVKKNLISEEEFQKIRNQVKNNFVSQNATDAGVAENLAQYYVFFGNTDLINTEIDRFMKVTREDIKRVADKYLTNNNRVVLYYLPKSAEPKKEGK